MAPFFTGLAKNLGGYGFGRLSGGEVEVAASGGTIITNGSYTYHVFLTPDSFDSGVSTPGTVDIFLVGAGGGGADPIGGGGGAGGIVNQTSVSVTNSTTYPIVVGTGGVNDVQPNGGEPGGDSTGLSYTAYGGGGGGGYAETGESTNASGGGGGASEGSGSSGGTGGPQGNPGGSGSQYYGPSRGYHGGGGGGAGGAGSNSTPGNTTSAGGAGGPGSPYPAYAAPIIAPAIPTSTPSKANAPGNPLRTDFTNAVGPTGLYGGGGGGLNDSSSAGGQPAGGPGGGGEGGINPFGGPNPNGTPAHPGVNYTGGGGGGARSTQQGEGGDGIVIIRYLT